MPQTILVDILRVEGVRDRFSWPTHLGNETETNWVSTALRLWEKGKT